MSTGRRYEVHIKIVYGFDDPTHAIEVADGVRLASAAIADKENIPGFACASLVERIEVPQPITATNAPPAPGVN